MVRSADVPAFHDRPTRLRERDRELNALDQLIAATLAGSSGLLVIEGPAGIGKSRLVAEARTRAASAGLLVLSARSSELERDFPFGVVRQLFEPHLAGEALRARVLAGAGGAAASVFGLPRTGPDQDAHDTTFAALHGLYWVTVNLSSEAPLLLAVDDLHWCDRASLRFLGYLARRLEGLPVLVVASLRSSEPGVDESLLGDLLGDPAAVRLAPKPLTAGAAAELVRERLGVGVDPAFGRACHDATHGNPLFLTELLRTLDAEHVQPDGAHLSMVAELGPRAASRTVLVRLARLGPNAVSVARWVAVLGEGAEPEHVAALAELDAEAVAVAGRELVRAEILRPEARLGFVHPLVGAAVYRDLAPGEREWRHERAARVLHSLDAPAERVAAHLLAIPRQGEAWVRDVLRASVTAAFARGAPDEAIASLRRILLEPLSPEERTELLFELGKAQALMILPDAVPQLRSVYEAAVEPKAQGEAADWLACTLTFLDEADEAAEILRRTTLSLPPELEDLRQQLEAGELVSLFFGSPHDYADRLERLRRHRTIDPREGIGPKMLGALAAWEWFESAGPAAEVVALARSALAGGALIITDTPERIAGAILALALADLDEATEQWDAVRSEAHRTGFVYTMLAYQIWGGYTLHLRGELADAETELRGALATAGRWGVPSQQPWAAAVLAELLVDRGALTEARSLLDGTFRPRPGSDPAMLIDRAWTRLLLAEGRNEAALEQSEVLREHAGWRRHPRYAPWRSLQAQALDRLGRTPEAVALATEELEIARQWGSPGTVGRSLRVLGTLEREDGLDHLEQACELLSTVPARLERAKALTALGESLRRARRPTDAREPLRKALELAQISGADAIVERARTELYATGARPRTTAIHGIDSLTASERRVADLALDGASNRDIAQALYVTPKTVEVHLSNAYRKLGIGSRRELQHALR